MLNLREELDKPHNVWCLSQIRRAPHIYQAWLKFKKKDWQINMKIQCNCINTPSTTSFRISLTGKGYVWILKARHLGINLTNDQIYEVIITNMSFADNMIEGILAALSFQGEKKNGSIYMIMALNDVYVIHKPF